MFEATLAAAHRIPTSIPSSPSFSCRVRHANIVESFCCHSSTVLSHKCLGGAYPVSFQWPKAELGAGACDDQACGDTPMLIDLLSVACTSAAQGSIS